MNRSVYSFLHFPAPDMTAGGYILTDGQHQHGGYAYTKRRGGLGVIIATASTLIWISSRHS